MALEENYGRSFRNGEIVFREGSVGSCAYLIESGAIEISIQQDGQTVVLATRKAGDIFGEMAMVDNQPRSATARAVGRVQLLVLSQEHLSHRLENCDPVIRLVLGTILQRFRETLDSLQYAVSDAGVPMADNPTHASRRRDSGLRMFLGKEDALDRLKLEQEVAAGLKRRELVLHFQPIVDLNNGAIHAVEGLVRWEHPTKGLLMPGAFLGVVDAGAIVRNFGTYIVDAACDAAVLMGEHCTAGNGMAQPKIHINISPKHLLQPDFVDAVCEAAAAHGVAPGELVLEVTEDLLIDRPDEALQALSACTNRGFEVSLDDFGTGYSSLSYLRQFPLAEIKIDRSFVSQMFSDERSMKILETLCDLANTLKLRLVAEGIEDAQQAEVLRSLGCRYGQGYHFARPLPLDDVLALLDRGSVALAS